MKAQPNNPELLPKQFIWVHIPKQFLMELYARNDYITRKEASKTLRKLREIDSALNQLNHIKSIVEKILLKKPYSDSRL